MTNRTCGAPGCTHPATNAFICRVCADALKADLAAIPDLIPELITTMARLDVAEPDPTRPPAGCDEHLDTDQPIATTTLPYRVDAAECIRALHNDLTTWTRHLIESRYGAELDELARDANYRRAWPGPGEPHGPWRRGPQLPDPDSVELARWLGRHLETIKADEAAGELVGDIARHVVRAKTVIYPDAVEYLGPCPCTPLLCHHSRPDRCECSRPTSLPPVDLYVSKGAVRVTCPRCGTTDMVAERREWLFAQATDQFATAADASRALVDYVRDVRAGLPERPFTSAAIRGLAHRGRIRQIPAHPNDPTGSPRYQVGELLELVKEIAAQDRAKAERKPHPSRA